MNADVVSTTWKSTVLARDEATLRSSGLSIRQRKILAFLSAPMSVSGLAELSGISTTEVESSIQKFEKLGLVTATTAGEAPAAFRAESFGAASAAGGGNSKMLIGGAGLLVVGGAIAWYLLSSSSAPARPNAQTGTGAAPGAAAQPLERGGDSATTNSFLSVFSSGAREAEKSRNEAAAREAAARDAEKAARDAAAAKAAPAAATASANTPAPSAPAPAAAAVTAPAPAPISNPAPAPVAAAPAPAPVAPPPVVATPAPQPAAPAPAPAPAAAPVAAAPAPQPAPATARAPAREAALLSRVEPQFPRNVDVDRGTVRARLSINAQGAVTEVEVVEANPPRVFDRNVRNALGQWKYEATGEASTKLVEVVFQR